METIRRCARCPHIGTHGPMGCAAVNVIDGEMVPCSCRVAFAVGEDGARAAFQIGPPHEYYDDDE